MPLSKEEIEETLQHPVTDCDDPAVCKFNKRILACAEKQGFKVDVPPDKSGTDSVGEFSRKAAKRRP